MHSVYWWRVWGKTREGKKGLACFATNPNSLCCAGTQLLSTATFTTLTFRMLSSTNCSKFAHKSASPCCDNEHDKRELNIFLISEFGGSRRLRAGITDRSFWFVFVILLHTTDRTQRASIVYKMHFLFQWMSSMLSASKASWHLC